MRNIQIFRKFASASPLPLTHSSAFCVGEYCNLFYVFGQDDSSEGYLTRITDSAEVDELVKNSFLQDVFHMQFVSNTGCLYLGNKRGQFLQFYLHAGEIEELFQSETGLVMFAVSPDSRFVSIITRSGVLLLMSLPNLELVYEEQFLDWKECEDAEAGRSSVEMCWRHDSQYFAVNAPDGKAGRNLRVYDEHGTLFSTTEDTINIINAIVCWQPSGGLIAGIETPPTGKEGSLITFFELNGLRRSSFNAYLGKDKNMDVSIMKLLWNSSSDILAVVYENTAELWHRSNYHWMCKSVIQRQFNETGAADGIKFFAWDNEHPYKFYVIYQSGAYSFCEFNLGYSSGSSGGSALTVSINRNTLYCSPFRDNSAPPPYGFFQISVESAVKEAVISSFWDGFLCILYTGKIVLVKNFKTELRIVNTLCPEENSHLLSSYNWIWPNSRTVCCICDHKILVFQLPEIFSEPELPSSSFSLLYTVPLNCSSLSVVPELPGYSESEQILVKTQNGVVLFSLQSLGDLTFHPDPFFKLPSDCFHNMKTLVIGESGEGDAGLINRVITIVFDQLTRKLELFSFQAHAKVSTDCTSVAAFDEYLLFTTIQGTLEIIHMAELQKALTASSEGVRAKLEQYSRKVEKGSVILTCCWNRLLEPTLVLQVLPRGSLETIHPRPLVIASIKTLLRDKAKRSFSVIMGAMRRHRIDANVLLEELKNFEKESGESLTVKEAFCAMLEEVKDSNILVLFVTEITPENFEYLHLMKTVLQEYITEDKGKSGIQPYLATIAKLGHFEEVLNSQLVIGEEDREVVKSRVKFLSFYADNADTLYEAALGTYDLSLTAIVADCLNKDPKEYLPILNNLRSLPVLKRNFSIDNTLKRWVNALKSLLEDETVEIEQITKFTERHRLFPDALRLLSSHPIVKARSDAKSIEKALQNSYGDYLEAHEKYREASIFYKRGGSTIRAVESAVKGGSWEAALVANESPEDLQKLYRDILSALRQKKDWGSAARFCEVYFADYSLALEYWVNAKKWLSAHALVLKESNLSHMISKLIKPKLLEHCSSLEDSSKALLQQSKHHITRFRAVKLKKEAKRLACEENGENFSDTESISTTSSVRSTAASSAQTGMTGRTYRSGKSKRKLERKLYSLKEGSRHEDIAITAHLWESVSRLQQEMKPDVANTVESLWRFDMDEKAAQLARVFDELVAEIDKIIKEIWATPLDCVDQVLEPRYRIAPVTWTSTWDKLSFL